MSDERVLLVDDEVDYLAALTKRLARRGIQAAVAYTAAEGFRLLDEGAFDVVVLDVNLPDKSGLDALPEIKRRHPFVEVIMLTGHASLEWGAKGLSLGAFDYILKPVDLDVLVQKLSAAGERKRLHQGPTA